MEPEIPWKQRVVKHRGVIKGDIRPDQGGQRSGIHLGEDPCFLVTVHITDQGTHKIDNAWMQRVGQVVNYVLVNDMFAVINVSTGTTAG